VAAGSRDGALLIWHAHTGKLLASRAKAHDDAVSSIAFAPDGKTLVSGSWDRTVKTWDSKLNSRRIFAGHADQVCCVGFTPDGKSVVSGSRDRTARLWDLATGHALEIFQGHTAAVNVIALDRGGPSVATGSLDQTVRIWKPWPG